MSKRVCKNQMAQHSPSTKHNHETAPDESASAALKTSSDTGPRLGPLLSVSLSLPSARERDRARQRHRERQKQVQKRSNVPMDEMFLEARNSCTCLSFSMDCFSSFNVSLPSPSASAGEDTTHDRAEAYTRNQGPRHARRDISRDR